MITEKDLPPYYNSLLFDLKIITGQNAIIAGGCLRDMDNDRPIKDIDVFMYAPSVEAAIEIHNSIKTAGLLVEDKILSEKNFYPESGSTILTVFDITTHEEEHPIQIIIVRVGLDCLDKIFDFGMCMISYDGVELKKYPQYIAEKHEKVFRNYINESACLDRIVQRWERLKVKYPDFKSDILDIRNRRYLDLNSEDRAEQIELMKRISIKEKFEFFAKFFYHQNSS